MSLPFPGSGALYEELNAVTRKAWGPHPCDGVSSEGLRRALDEITASVGKPVPEMIVICDDGEVRTLPDGEGTCVYGVDFMSPFVT